ncbi:unnamed protein product [Amoebophrya sp. A25]|nr:unnamed protein product [Amoebophrya sp. A25]|eukprot:GSA25T00002538001.1
MSALRDATQNPLAQHYMHQKYIVQQAVAENERERKNAESMKDRKASAKKKRPKGGVDKVQRELKKRNSRRGAGQDETLFEQANADIFAEYSAAVQRSNKQGGNIIAHFGHSDSPFPILEAPMATLAIDAGILFRDVLRDPRCIIYEPDGGGNGGGNAADEAGVDRSDTVSRFRRKVKRSLGWRKGKNTGANSKTSRAGRKPGVGCLQRHLSATMITFFSGTRASFELSPAAVWDAMNFAIELAHRYEKTVVERITTSVQLSNDALEALTDSYLFPLMHEMKRHTTDAGAPRGIYVIAQQDLCAAEPEKTPLSVVRNNGVAGSPRPSAASSSDGSSFSMLSKMFSSAASIFWSGGGSRPGSEMTARRGGGGDDATEVGQQQDATGEADRGQHAPPLDEPIPPKGPPHYRCLKMGNGGLLLTSMHYSEWEKKRRPKVYTLWNPEEDRLLREAAAIPGDERGFVSLLRLHVAVDKYDRLRGYSMPKDDTSNYQYAAYPSTSSSSYSQQEQHGAAQLPQQMSQKTKKIDVYVRTADIAPALVTTALSSKSSLAQMENEIGKYIDRIFSQGIDERSTVVDEGYIFDSRFQITANSGAPAVSTSLRSLHSGATILGEVRAKAMALLYHQSLQSSSGSSGGSASRSGSSSAGSSSLSAAASSKNSDKKGTRQKQGDSSASALGRAIAKVWRTRQNTLKCFRKQQEQQRQETFRQEDDPIGMSKSKTSTSLTCQNMCSSTQLVELSDLQMLMKHTHFMLLRSLTVKRIEEEALKRFEEPEGGKSSTGRKSGRNKYSASSKTKTSSKSAKTSSSLIGGALRRRRSWGARKKVNRILEVATASAKRKSSSSQNADPDSTRLQEKRPPLLRPPTPAEIDAYLSRAGLRATVEFFLGGTTQNSERSSLVTACSQYPRWMEQPWPVT